MTYYSALFNLKWGKEQYLMKLKILNISYIIYHKTGVKIHVLFDRLGNVRIIILITSLGTQRCQDY